MTRVLFIVGLLGGGGAERQLATLLKHRRDRFEPHCFLLSDGGVWRDTVEKESETFNVARYRSRVLREIEFLRRVSAVQPDVIHCWHAYTAVYPLVSRSWHRRPVIANLRGDPTEGDFKAQPKLLGLLSRAELVISNSPFTLEVLQHNGVHARRTAVIPNGIYVPSTTLPRPDNDPPRVVGIGSLLPKKNWEQLIRACGQLRRGGRSLSLTIFGEGHHRMRLEELCAEWDLDSGSVLPGYVDDLPGRLQQADVLVHPSLTEGLPNAVLEGLAAGLPVVASDLDICRQLGAEGDFLHLFPVGNDDACRQALARILDDPAARTEGGQQGRRFVQANYDSDAMAGRYATLYDELAGKESPRAKHGDTSQCPAARERFMIKRTRNPTDLNSRHTVIAWRRAGNVL